MTPYIDFNGDHGPRYTVYATENGEITRILTPTSPNGNFPHPKQIEYFDAQAPNVLIGGSRGPGKTEAIIWDHIFKAYLMPGSLSAILRRTGGELLTTVIRRFERLAQEAPELVGEYIANPTFRHMSLPNGSTIQFASAKDKAAVHKSLGGEYILVSFDEWATWDYDDWTFVAGACRSTATKDIFGRPYRAQIKGATQPGGSGSDALNRLFGGDIPQQPALEMEASEYDPKEYFFIPCLVDDNPAYGKNTEAGKAYHRMLDKQPPARRAAWKLGKWTGFEGQYFDAFEAKAVKIPHAEVVQGMAAQRHQPIWISNDYGKVHHTYSAWHTFLHAQLRNGREVKIPVTYREWLDKELGEAAVAAEISERTPGPEEYSLFGNERGRVQKIYRSPELGTGRLSRAGRMDDVFVSMGLPISTPAFNDREDGWSVMYGLLAERYELLNGWQNEQGEEIRVCAGWLIDEQCEYLLAALPWAKSDPDHDGDIVARGDSPMLDILDGARYGIASHIRPEEQKPFDERVKDELGRLPVAGSSRFMRYLKMKADERTNTQPFYTGQRTAFGVRQGLRRRR